MTPTDCSPNSFLGRERELLPNLGAVDAIGKNRGQALLEAARPQEAVQCVGTRHLLASLDAGDGGLWHATSSGELPL